MNNNYVANCIASPIFG
jgi:hypothetical protein